MKGSLFLAATGAAMAMAGPIAKRAVVVDWVEEIVTVTVTQTGTGVGALFVEKTSAPPTTTTTAAAPTLPPPPPPEPTTTSSSTSSSSSKKKIIPLPSIKPLPVPEPKPSSKPAPKPKPSPKPEPSPEPEQPSGDDDYSSGILDQHNVHRANHSSPALSWDDELAEWAKNTAKTCVFEHDMNQGSGGYGQNLASYGGSAGVDESQMAKIAKSGVSSWYNTEMSKFDSLYGESSPTDYMAWGHFTQLVWKGSKKVGCGTVKCAAGTVLSYESFFTVCNYKEPGNMAGAYNTNVLKPKGEAVVAVTI